MEERLAARVLVYGAGARYACTLPMFPILAGNWRIKAEHLKGGGLRSSDGY